MRQRTGIRKEDGRQGGGGEGGNWCSFMCLRGESHDKEHVTTAYAHRVVPKLQAAVLPSMQQFTEGQLHCCVSAIWTCNSRFSERLYPRQNKSLTVSRSWLTVSLDNPLMMHSYSTLRFSSHFRFHTASSIPSSSLGYMAKRRQLGLIICTSTLGTVDESAVVVLKQVTELCSWLKFIIITNLSTKLNDNSFCTSCFMCIL